jgi:hypothetical protein
VLAFLVYYIHIPPFLSLYNKGPDEIVCDMDGSDKGILLNFSFEGYFFVFSFYKEKMIKNLLFFTWRKHQSSHVTKNDAS